MARMRPTISDASLFELESSAEAKFYRACRDQLPENVLVLHSTAWVYKGRNDRVVEGETDFILVFKEAGILAVEIKGGGIAIDGATGEWTSIDRNGVRHKIKDPVKQASRERFAVLDQISGHALWRQWTSGRILIGHAVCFPDVENTTPLTGPDRPAQILGGRHDLEHLVAWLGRVLAFWKGGNSYPSLGPQGVRLVEEIFSNSVEVRPLLVSELEDEERVRIKLTERQAKTLRILGGRKRAVIAGGAGTGKTLIAVKNARTLAANGDSVLFLCYNRPLADVLGAGLDDVATVHVMNFHQLCERRIVQVFKETGEDLMRQAEEAFPGGTDENKFDVQMPFALALSNEKLDEKFDAIVVDEAQDFSDDYWFAIEDLLKDPENGRFYIFLDPNQALYKRHANLPVVEDPFVLSENCRNTKFIHTATYGFYRGDPVEPPEIEGRPIEIFNEESSDAQATRIEAKCRLLLLREKISPQNITVLLARRPKQDFYDLLARHRLPVGFQWSFEVPGRLNSIFVDTVARFKGLEAQIVFLWLDEERDERAERETLYVGTSRAKSQLYLVGTSRACSRVDLIGGSVEGPLTRKIKSSP